MLGQFPEQVGESIIVDSPARDDGRAYPPGALVVGLGSPGEITREQLTATAAAAMLRFAIEIFEGQRAPEDEHERPARLRFSAVPIGTTSAGGLSTEACVAALVDAVVTVNDQLFRHSDPERGGCWDTVRICALEFVALWEDRAELVAHALRRLPQLLQVDSGMHTRLELCERLVVREGALRRRPQSEERAGEWQRLIIRDRQREQTVGTHCWSRRIWSNHARVHGCRWPCTSRPRRRDPRCRARSSHSSRARPARHVLAIRRTGRSTNCCSRPSSSRISSASTTSSSSSTRTPPTSLGRRWPPVRAASSGSAAVCSASSRSSRASVRMSARPWASTYS